MTTKLKIPIPDRPATPNFHSVGRPAPWIVARENDDGLSLGGRGFHYLADLVLRSGQTYLGDVVAMGGRPVGRGVGGDRALVHKVEPGASSQVVLIVDWGVEREA